MCLKVDAYKKQALSVMPTPPQTHISKTRLMHLQNANPLLPSLKLSTLNILGVVKIGFWTRQVEDKQLAKLQVPIFHDKRKNLQFSQK